MNGTWEKLTDKGGTVHLVPVHSVRDDVTHAFAPQAECGVPTGRLFYAPGKPAASACRECARAVGRRRQKEKLPMSVAPTPMADRLPCPHCRGTRTAVLDCRLVAADGSSHREFRHIVCGTCQGEGTITTAHAARIDAGKARRADRLNRGLSLRAEAARLGLAERDILDIEMGREPKEEK